MGEPIKDLIQFKTHQIEALQKKLYELESRITLLESYLFEVTDKDCPQDYRQIIRNEVFKTDKDERN